MSAEYQPVRVVFRGWREEGRGRREHDGAFPSVNDIGIPGSAGFRRGGAAKALAQTNEVYRRTKFFYGMMLRALLQEPPGTEYEFIKPGTKTTRVIVPIERDGDLPHPLGFVAIEGCCYWPDRILRDQNNYLTMIAKFLPDVLQDAGYVEHDDWTRLQIGGFGRGLDSRSGPYTEMMFFPAPERMELVNVAGRVWGLF